MDTQEGTDISNPDGAAISTHSAVGIVDILTWLGEAKYLLAVCTGVAASIATAIALLVPPVYTARTSLLPPGAQQPSGAAASLAALGALGGLAGGLSAKTPDELYVSLLRSDSVGRSLATRYALMERYETTTFEALRKELLQRIRITADKKTSIINIEVDDKDPKFAADLANAHAPEVMKVMGRLAVSEAQQRRVFFELQLKETKENLVNAETGLRRVQEQSGMIALERQADALVGSVAQLRALIAEREIRLRVLRTSATEQNPEVQRLTTEVAGLRAEQARLESSQGGGGTRSGQSSLAVNRLPEAAIEYVRARRELKLQETLLEAMIRQYELAKLDEAKEGPLLQQVDVALAPDARARPSRALIVIAMSLLGAFLGGCWVVFRRYTAMRKSLPSNTSKRLLRLRAAWSLKFRGTPS